MWRLGRSRWRFLAAALPVLLAIVLLAACGEAYRTVGSHAIEVSNARARFTTTDLGAVYFDIAATGARDVFIGASSEIAEDTQIHEVVIENGSAMMRPVQDGIPIDPGGRVSLQPGGHHLMLLGVEEIPEIGSTFEIVLEFERAGSLTVTVHVEEFGADDASTDHGDVDSDKMDGEEAVDE